MCSCALKGNLFLAGADALESSHTELHSNIAFVAAGFSLRCTGETPVPPRKIGRKIFDWPQLGIKTWSCEAQSF
jgi:hypothetical protein